MFMRTMSDETAWLFYRLVTIIGSATHSYPQLLRARGRSAFRVFLAVDESRNALSG